MRRRHWEQSQCFPKPSLPSSIFSEYQNERKPYSAKNDKARAEEPKVHRFEVAHDVNLLIVDGREVLEASNPLSFKQAYQGLSDRILASDSAANLIALFNKLKTL